MRSAALLVLAGCSLAPAYERPAPPIANAYPGGAALGRARPAAELGWREVFGDARLQTLVELALRNNRDLRVAALNVELAQATYRIERAALFPQLGASASLTVGRSAGATGPETGVRYQVGAGISAYELDLFGRVRNLKDAALEEYLASAEAQRAAHLALVAEVATQYLRERAYDEERAIAEQALAAANELLAITSRLFEAGQRSELDVRTAEAQSQAARSEVIRLTRLRAQAEHALVLLCGQPLPPSLPAPRSLDALAIIADIPAGLPSELLLRRPDILAAEHALRAANFQIGAARAALYPSISLTGLAGFASTALSSLFTGGAFAWSVTPELAVPLFTGGRATATVDAARVRKRIEIARYEQAIQVAFREVADALVARASLDDQLAAQTARVTAEQRRFDISQTRYKNGIESFLTVLTAQRDLYATQTQLIEARLERLGNLARLYAALGGGWKER